jgi:hypothetical protein
LSRSPAPPVQGEPQAFEQRRLAAAVSPHSSTADSGQRVEVELDPVGEGEGRSRER